MNNGRLGYRTYVDTTVAQPYSLPRLSLPINEGWDVNLRHLEDAAIRRSVSELSTAIDALIEQLGNQVVAPGQYAETTACLSAAAHRIASTLPTGDAEPPAFDLETFDRQEQNRIIYDRFFQVQRSTSITTDALASNLLVTFGNVLADLQYSAIARSEAEILLRTMPLILRQFTVDSEHFQTLVVIEPKATTDRAISAAWSEVIDPTSWTKRVADHRWLSGHHFFFILANFGRVTRDRTVTALEQGTLDQVPDLLETVGVFHRALASAMWYACDFPPALYQTHTRAWMSSAGAENGFSGSDNRDYAGLHESRVRLRQALRNHLGESTDDWPETIAAAHRSMREAEIEHAEHHVQIAARMVGADTSLVQKRMRRVVYNAVDLLREMVQDEWAES